MGVQADTLKALDDQFSRVGVIRNRIGMWADDSVRHALLGLTRSGLAERRAIPFPASPCGVAYTYRRAPHAVETV